MVVMVTQLVDIGKTTELYTLRGWIFWYVYYIYLNKEKKEGGNADSLHPSNS